MSDYEDKKQARIDRYRERAEQARAQSSALWKQSSDMASAIPVGQPIHGARDQRYRDRIMKKAEQSFAASDKAAYYEQKAEAAENNTAISSDDPDALAKLTEKLESLQIMQTRMKQINAYYRKHGTCRGFHGLSDEDADKLISDVQYHPWDRSPYPAYALSNNNAAIRQVKGRIQKLTEAKELGYQGWEFDGGRVVANSENNRLQVFFDEKPDEEVRQALKGQGFRWARSEGAWQRQLTDNAIYAAKAVKAIQPSDGSDPVKIQPKRKPGPKH
ncbi:MAG: DUF3560 domain-containing protein [Oscillospiraceae bacterium]|nr:DUF3560 domain-containing protein [Oscillospiraceae bacterium]